MPAFDAVQRPTKSVSILYGLGDPATRRAVLAAHHAGMAEATAYLDEHLGTRRGHAGHDHVSGQGLLAVGFDRRTSREGDPLLHTHLVIANRVQGPDGRWTALDGRDLYRHRRLDGKATPSLRNRTSGSPVTTPAVPDPARSVSAGSQAADLRLRR